jgi:predicted amidohydrolase YtcJ
MNTGGGHSMLHNTKALEWMGYDAEYAKRMGPELVHVDENGEPDGYVSEMAAISVVNKLPSSIERAKSYLLAWQDMTLANGFTAVADAGVDLNYKDNAQAYYALEQEGKLKLRTYGYMYVPDNAENPEAEVARIAQDRARYSGEYFEIVGVKAFLDGVTEAHTAWQNEDYANEPGYHGVERFSDHDKMVCLIVAANAEGMPVHVHSEGGGATHFMLDCIEDTEKVTGNLDHVVFHSDCPISTQMDVSRSVYMAETRALVDGGMVTQRNPSEAIDREQSLKAMTIKVPAPGARKTAWVPSSSASWPTWRCSTATSRTTTWIR